MNHGERIHIATELSNKILRKYGDDIIYIGIYGSTAKGNDRPDSDIDMIVISKTMSSWTAYHLKDVTVWLAFKTMAQHEDDFYHPRFESWPYEVGQLMYAMTLYDPNNFISDMKTKIGKLDKQLFVKPIEEHLNQAEELMIKLVHSSQEKDIAAVRYWVPFFIENTNLMIALINRGWFTYGGTKTMLNIQHDFKEVPRNYIDDCRALLVINDCSAVGKIAEDIWEDCRKFAEKHGVKPRKYGNEKDIDP